MERKVVSVLVVLDRHKDYKRKMVLICLCIDLYVCECSGKCQFVG